jgi:putative membrane protein
LNSFTRGLVGTIAIMAACTIQADDKDLKQTGTPGGGKDKASTFVREAAMGNAAEVALAEVAARKGQNAELKQFAEHIRKDHTEANTKLQPIAQKHGVSISQSLDAKHQKKLEKLQQTSGAEFDKEYATEMLRDHQKDIAKYQKCSTHAEDAELKSYATEMLPKLRQHLQHAQQVAKAVGVDQETITSLSKEIPEGVGGTSDREESDSAREEKESGKSDSSTTKP